MGRSAAARTVLRPLTVAGHAWEQTARWLGRGLSRRNERELSRQVALAREMAADIAAARDEALAATAAKSRFLATMSHEIRTPLNAVIGLTGLLFDTPLTAHQRDLVETVRASGDALLDLINEVLDFSKIEAGELTIEQAAFDVVDVVDTAIDLVAPTALQKGLELSVHLADGCPVHVIGDAARLRQVLLNLLSNAIKFTAEGQVKVHISAEDGGDGDVRLTMAVADTGIGIPSEAVSRLFTPFTQVDPSTTREYGGTGLGLAITRRLVDAMGGSIAVQSTPGSGSCFTFSVTARRAGGTTPFPAPALRGRRVLLGVGAGNASAALVEQLTDWGIECVSVGSLHEELLRYDRETPWDVVVTTESQFDDKTVALLADLPTTSVVLFRGPGEALTPIRHLRFSDVLYRPVKLRTLHDILARATGVTTRTPVVAARQSGPPPMPLRVLLAEDNPVNQKVGRLLLRKLGYVDVDVVSNGVEAVNAARLRNYDVILMDVQMPKVDGLEATRRIRALDVPEFPPRIVALTAAATASDREACAAAGMDGYLSKPIQETALRSVLGSTRAGDAMPEPTATTVDGDALQELFDQLGYTDAATVELIDQFITTTSASVCALRQAAAAGDAGEIVRLAHDLRSTAALFGARELARLVTDIESAVRSGSQDLACTVSAIATEFVAVEATLRSRGNGNGKEGGTHATGGLHDVVR